MRAFVCARAKSLPYTHAHPQISDESHTHTHVYGERRMHGVKSQNTIRADSMWWISSHRDTMRFSSIFSSFYSNRWNFVLNERCCHTNNHPDFVGAVFALVLFCFTIFFSMVALSHTVFFIRSQNSIEFMLSIAL